MITCQFEDQAKVQLRHLCVNVLVIKDSKILLGKRGTYQKKPILEAGKWALLGGFLDRDETLIQGAQREVLEESGWSIANLKLLRINDNPHRPAEDRQNIDVIFSATPISHQPIKSEEVTHLEWFDLDNLPQSQEIAFDHVENILIYKEFLENTTLIPLYGNLEPIKTFS